MPHTWGNLQQVFSSRPWSHNFTSANGSLHRLRMCRLHWQHSTIILLISCNLLCSETLAALQEGLELNLQEQRLAGHLGWNKWHIEITPPHSCKISGRLAFIFVCLFIHVFKRERYFSPYEKPVPSRTQKSLKWCWQAPGISLTPPRHPRLSWQ